MTTITGHDRDIEDLLRHEFPAYFALMPQPLRGLGSKFVPVDLEQEQKLKELRKRIEARLQELLVMKITKPEDFAKLTGEYRQREADKTEQQRFFNQPHARADFGHWGKLAYWSLDEGVALCFGRDPRVVTWKSVEPLVNVSLFAKQFSDAREIASRAALVKEIEQSNIPGPFIAWAKRVGLPFPAELETKVAERGPIADWRAMYEQERTAHATTVQPANARIAELASEAATGREAAKAQPESRPLETLERETLLALIGTLCELAGFDLRKSTKGHAEARAMKSALEARNVTLTPQTVAAKIEAGRELIAPKGPTRLEFK